MVVIGWKSVRCSTFFITQRRKDMDKLLYSSSLSPPWQMRGWGYGQADGRWRRLFPEQDTIDDKDNASDADSSTPNHKPHLIPPLSQKRNPQRQIRRSKRRPRILPSRLLLWKKNDRNSRSTSSELCWIRRHSHRFPHSNRRLPTWSIHAYPTHPPREILIHIIVGGQVSYLLTNVSELSTSVLNLLYSLWVGYDSNLSLSILLRATPSVCEPECIATLLSMVAVTLPNASFCTFLFTIGWYTRISKVGVTATGVLLDAHRTTKIVRKLKLKGVLSDIFKNTAWKSLNSEKPKF